MIQGTVVWSLPASLDPALHFSSFLFNPYLIMYFSRCRRGLPPYRRARHATQLHQHLTHFITCQYFHRIPPFPIDSFEERKGLSQLRITAQFPASSHESSLPLAHIKRSRSKDSYTEGLARFFLSLCEHLVLYPRALCKASHMRLGFFCGRELWSLALLD